MKHSGLQWWQLFSEIPRRERDPLGTIRAWHSEYGTQVRIPIRTPSSWSFTGLDDIRHVLVTNNDNYRKVGWLTLGHRFLGNGLLTSSGDLHQQNRTIMQPLFHRAEIQQFAGIIVDEVDRRIADWKEGELVNISHEMARLTLATVGRSFFGHSFDDVADELLGVFLTCQRFMARWTSFLPDSVPTPKALRYRRATDRIDRIVDELIRENGGKADLLKVLLSAKGMNGRPLSRRLVRDEIVTILWAGHETACNALEWGWHLLSQNPGVELRLHQEVDQILGGEKPTIEDAARLKFTEMVLAEVLRMYPPAWILARWAIGEDQLPSGLHLPEGSIVFISPYAVHHDPRWFPEPDTFDPDRFLSARRAERPSLSYIPFGAGQRVCIGEHFGRLEGVLILARIAQQFQLTSVPGQPVEPWPLLTLRMKQDLRLIASKRMVGRQTTPRCLHDIIS